MATFNLTDIEAVLLDGACSKKSQELVDAAKARLEAAAAFTDVEPHIAALIADVLGEARRNGILGFAHETIVFCSYCHAQPEPRYVAYKSGPRKGQPNYDKRRFLGGVEFARSLGRMRHHISVGGCNACVDAANPRLMEVLRDVPAQVPDVLRHPDAPKRVKSPNKRCPVCDWVGHEHQMTRERTVLADGWYYAGCPKCGAKNQFLSANGPNTVDGFVIVEL